TDSEIERRLQNRARGSLTDPDRPHNLPAELSSFVGRTQEMADALALLQRARLLTLTGPGGAGKTRLALGIVDEILPSFQDGVWLVELEGLNDQSLVLPTVASHFGAVEAPGLPLLDRLTHGLQARAVLIVLDNCEHLAPACAALVERLLRSCPR